MNKDIGETGTTANTAEYAGAQRAIRASLVELLRRCNGAITKEDYLKYIAPYSGKLLLRLFHVENSERLEWKTKIRTEQDLFRLLGPRMKQIPDSMLELFNHSREIQNRSLYPHLAYARKKTQYSNESDFPVFGFDLLIRPPVAFSNGTEKKNNFSIGHHSFAYFIHANPNSFLLRANMGDDIMRLGINEYIDKEVSCVYEEIQLLYNEKQYYDLAKTMCQSCNSAIKKWLFAGV